MCRQRSWNCNIQRQRQHGYLTLFHQKIHLLLTRFAYIYEKYSTDSAAIISSSSDMRSQKMFRVPSFSSNHTTTVSTLFSVLLLLLIIILVLTTNSALTFIFSRNCFTITLFLFLLMISLSLELNKHYLTDLMALIKQMYQQSIAFYVLIPDY